MIFLGAVAASVALALLRGRRVLALADVRVRLWGLVVLAFVLRLGLRHAGQAGWTALAPYAPWMHDGSYLALVAAVVANRRLPWIGLAGLGVLANLAVIAGNGGRMPVAVPDGAAGAGPGAGALGFPGDYMHAALGPTTRLPWLGDWIHVGWPLARPESFSPGDLLLAVGVFLMIQRLATARGRNNWSVTRAG